MNFSRLINTVNATAFGLPGDINAIDRQNLESSINFLLGRGGATNRGWVSDGDKYGAGLYDFLAKYDEYDFYVQDTWKVRRNLTIDLGLRLEMKMAPTAGAGRVRRPDQLMTAGALPTDTTRWVEGGLYRSDRNNLGPSIGFAWAPGSDGKTSVRGNYRIAYDRINTFVLEPMCSRTCPVSWTGWRIRRSGRRAGVYGISNNWPRLRGVRRNWHSQNRSRRGTSRWWIELRDADDAPVEPEPATPGDAQHGSGDELHRPPRATTYLARTTPIRSRSSGTACG